MQSTHQIQADKLTRPQPAPKPTSSLHDEAMAPFTREYRPHDAQAPNAFTRQQAQSLNPVPQGKRGQ